jgi:hypothetical protein
MAELTTAETTTADPCCAAEQQATCCEPSAKADCCGHEEGCGCAADTIRADDARLLSAAFETTPRSEGQQAV